MRSALSMSAAMARSIREISREVTHPPSAVHARPIPTMNGNSCGWTSVNRTTTETAAVNSRPTVTTVKM